MGHGIAVQAIDPPSSILGGEAFLSRLYNAYKGMQSTAGSNVWNTALLIGWDEPGGTCQGGRQQPTPCDMRGTGAEVTRTDRQSCTVRWCVTVAASLLAETYG